MMNDKLVHIKKLPRLLFKYRDFNNKDHLTSLFESTIYFASPNNFNDIYDCKIPIRYDLADDNHYREQLIKWIEKENNDYTQEFQDLYVSKFIDSDLIKNLKKIRVSDLHKSFRVRKTGVFCLSRSFYNLLMWAHYSLNHTGFCIGYSTDFLMDLNADFTGKIKYIKKYPKILPSFNDDENIKNQFFVKSIDWKYENEYRLLFKSIKDNDRLVEIEKKAIEIVYLGASMEKYKKEVFVKLIDKYLPHISIFEAKIDDDEFKLKFNKLK